MDVRSVAPIQFQEVLAIPGANRRAGFVVSADQTVTGQVIDVDHDNVLIQIGQHRVSARAAGTSLRSGETISLQVDTLDPDEVIMRLVARGSSATTLRSLTDDDLGAELARMGVQAGPDTLAVARALIARGVPVTSRNVLMARAALGRLDDPTAADLDAIAFLQSRELPLSRDAIAIARGALAARTTLGGDVARLRDLLAGLNARVAALLDGQVFDDAASTSGSRGAVPTADGEQSQPSGGAASLPTGRGLPTSSAAIGSTAAPTLDEGTSLGGGDSVGSVATGSGLVDGRQPALSGPDAGAVVPGRMAESSPGRARVGADVENTTPGGETAAPIDEALTDAGAPGRRPGGTSSTTGQSLPPTSGDASEVTGSQSSTRRMSAPDARLADGSESDAAPVALDARRVPGRPADGVATDWVMAKSLDLAASGAPLRTGRDAGVETGRSSAGPDDVDVVVARPAVDEQLADANSNRPSVGSGARSWDAAAAAGALRGDGRGDAPPTSSERDAPPGAHDRPMIGDLEATTNQIGERSDRPLRGGATVDRPSLARLVEVVAETLQQLPRVDDAVSRGDPDGITSELRRILSEHATPTEAKLARVLDGLASRDDLARLIDADLKMSLRALARDASAMVGRLSDGTAHSSLMDELRAVARHADGLLSRVEFQQMAAAATRTDGMPDAGYVTFQVPFGTGGEARSLTIRVRDEGDGRGTPRVDPANTHVVFQFDLENLRTVRVNLRVVGRKLTCQIGASDPAATALLAERSAELRSGLVGLGFAVDPIRCLALTADDMTLGEHSVAPRATRLDARV